jgi:hypothetical protein
MVDVNELIGNEYISVDVVRNAKNKRAVVIDAGEVVETKFGTRLMITVQLDAETKEWTLNRETIKNLKEQYGADSKEWVGKEVMLSTAEKDGRKYVVGFPL